MINKAIKTYVFIEKYKESGIIVNKFPNMFKLSSGLHHPPTKRIVVIEHIRIILLYSAKKKSANPIAEYSTLYPETNSASASGRSNG